MVADPIDLCHQGADRVIASYLFDSEEGPALFDCGPSSCLERLKEGLRRRGLALTDIRHLLLSHIHVDHAGAAGTLVREHPLLRVHVSPIGAPHLVDPARLEASARRLYGESFDALWGELAPVPQQNVDVVDTRVLTLDCFPSPGHASHHVCYLDAEGTLYAGDAVGVRIQPNRFVMPPTPPPDFDLAAWKRSLDEIERRAPERLALIHFGVVEDVHRHLDDLRTKLDDWANRVRAGAGELEFSESVRAEVLAAGDTDLETYERAMPFSQSYAGLRRYWQKQGES